jgi:hypothetical protein
MDPRAGAELREELAKLMIIYSTLLPLQHHETIFFFVNIKNISKNNLKK